MKFDMHYLFSPRHAKWIITSLVVLFSLLIIYEWSSLFFTTRQAPVSTNTLNQPKPNTQTKISNYVLSSSLFGVYVTNDLSGDNVKKSMLNVTVAGIMLGDKKTESQVILRSANGEEKTYQVGDKIPGGAVIKRIMAEGILVERDGALESLSLPKNDLTFEPVAEPLKEDE